MEELAAMVATGLTTAGFCAGVLWYMIKRTISTRDEEIKEIKDRHIQHTKEADIRFTKIHERVDSLQTRLPDDYVRRPELNQVTSRLDRMEKKLDRLLER